MAGAADVGLYTGVLLALMLLLAAVLRYELGMGAFVSAMLAVSVAAAGLLAALALQVALAVPLLWSIGALAASVLLFVTLYELAN